VAALPSLGVPPATSAATLAPASDHPHNEHPPSGYRTAKPSDRPPPGVALCVARLAVAEVGGGVSFATVDVESGFVRVPAARLFSWSMPHRKHGVKTRVAFLPYGRFRGGLSVLTPCLRRGAGVVRAGRQRPAGRGLSANSPIRLWTTNPPSQSADSKRRADSSPCASYQPH
jgi:hypothetical protein